jgi:hypothetical protein
MVETPAVSLETLSRGLDLLVEEESEIRSLLAQRIPLWRQRAALTGELVATCLATRGAEGLAA